MIMFLHYQNDSAVIEPQVTMDIEQIENGIEVDTVESFEEVFESWFV
jgi:hypothetical protein